MYKKMTRITAITMASLLLVLSLVFLPQASIQVNAAVPVIDISVISQESLKYICQVIVDNTDVIEETYIKANQLLEQANNVINDTLENNHAVGAELNEFISYIYPAITDQFAPTRFLSSILVKMGYFVTNATSYTIKLADHPIESILLGLELLRNGINPSKPDIDPEKVYNVTTETQVALKTIGDSAIETDRNSLYTLYDTITYQEYLELLDTEFYPKIITHNEESTGKGFYNTLKKCVQYIHDNVAEDSIVFFAWRTNSFQLVRSSSYKEIIYDGSYIYSDNGQLDKTFTDNNSSYSSIAYNGISGINDQTETYKNNHWISCDNYYIGKWDGWLYYSPYITRDGRIVKIWANQDKYNKYHDWSSGCPYNIITTPQYDTLTQDTIQPFGIKGENIEKVNMGEIYNGIVNNVTEQNDYSDNSVQNIANDYSSTVINNYYITQTPGDTGSDSDNNNVDTGTDIVPSDTQCTEHVNGFLEEIDTMGELFPSIIEKMSVWKQIPSDIGNFVKDGLSWLPPECVALIVSGVAAMVGIGVWRIFRG